MSKPTISRRILNVLTRIPKDIEWSDVLTNTTIGGGVGLLSAILLSRKRNRKRNALIGASIGSLLGGWSSVVARNVREEMGGHFNKNPDYYDPEKLVELAKKSGKDRITLYVSGANDTPGGAEQMLPDLSNKLGVFTYRWGDRASLAAAIDALKSKGHKVDVIGHSAGATAIFGALGRLSKNVKPDTVSLLDPVDIHWRRLVPAAKDRYSKLLQRITDKSMLHIAKNREVIDDTESSVSNKAIQHNPLTLTEVPNIRTLKHDDDHGMHTTGLRAPVFDEPLKIFGKTIHNRLEKYFNM